MVVTITSKIWDEWVDAQGKKSLARIFLMKNENNMSVEIMNWGATIVSLKVPDKDGVVTDVVMGYRSFEDYIHGDLHSPHFGGTVGRSTNRLRFGRYAFQNEAVQLTKNYGPHHRDGGWHGFDVVFWETTIFDNKIIFSYYSKDGEEGYPGDLIVFAEFSLTDDNKLTIEYTAKTTKPTYVNITNKSYFNLGGHDAGPFELYKHCLGINAANITEHDLNGIPTGKLIPVANTVFDFQNLQKLFPIGERVFEVPGMFGYNHNFCVNNWAPFKDDNFVARVFNPDNGRVLDIFSNQPGVQFSHANELPEHPLIWHGHMLDQRKLRGKVIEGGPVSLLRRFAEYYRHGAFSLQTQSYPDGPNHDAFPKSILRPGELYRNHTTYRFSVVENLLKDPTLLPTEL